MQLDDNIRKQWLPMDTTRNPKPKHRPSMARPKRVH
jgi:hypothetical protein